MEIGSNKFDFLLKNLIINLLTIVEEFMIIIDIRFYLLFEILTKFIKIMIKS